MGWLLRPQGGGPRLRPNARRSPPCSLFAPDRPPDPHTPPACCLLPPQGEELLGEPIDIEKAFPPE